MPRVDHAKVVFDKNEYLLVMQNDQNYLLSNKSGRAVIQIFHRGLVGGWNIAWYGVIISIGIFLGLALAFTGQKNIM